MMRNEELCILVITQMLKPKLNQTAWRLEQLRSKWVKQANVIYYRLAGRSNPRTLRKRLNDLLRHSKGRISENGPHKGGEIVWQLEGYTEFSVWIKSTEDPPTPRNLELEVLANFMNLTGKLPFGNRSL